MPVSTQLTETILNRTRVLSPSPTDVVVLWSKTSGAADMTCIARGEGGSDPGGRPSEWRKRYSFPPGWAELSPAMRQ